MRPGFIEALQGKGSVNCLGFLRWRSLHFAFSYPFPFSKGGKGKKKIFEAIKSAIAEILLLSLVLKPVVVCDTEKYA